ncbi:MAG: YdiU family protein [Pseudomonadota bacterium]
MTAEAAFPFDNSYARLPERFYARLDPAPAAEPRMIRLNRDLAAELGLDPAALDGPEGARLLSGAAVPVGADPIAQAYAGHQFGGFSPQLGDGRAILLGEVVDAEGRRRDLQLKGSGRTPFSRGGDGLAPLGPVLREYIVAEAMAALGVPTTRSLAAVLTGGRVVRKTVSPGAVLTRVAASHIRVGTFEFFAARQDHEALRTLTDYAIARHDPAAADAENPALAFYEGVIARQARLIARWMALGFIHGVMNTDNMTISGETIDYGPCAFMDGYDPQTVYSSIDHQGRYAYANQPGIAHWNLVCLAQAMLPVLAETPEAALEAAQGAVDRFPALYEAAWVAEMRAKLGLATEAEGDAALATDLLTRMAGDAADFTRTFRGLSEPSAARAEFADPAAFDAWEAQWQARLAAEGATPADRRDRLRAANPAVIPRNHMVEEAIAAGLTGDYMPFETLIGVLARPFDDHPDHPRHTRPPKAHEVVQATFCGT